MDRDVWNSHKWSSARGRQIEIEPGNPLIQHRCSRCKRDFVEDKPTGERYAVYVSVFSFRRLPDTVCRRWLEELCPGEPLPFDIGVRSKLIEKRVK
jgi:hypothetical protein